MTSPPSERVYCIYQDMRVQWLTIRQVPIDPIIRFRGLLHPGSLRSVLQVSNLTGQISSLSVVNPPFEGLSHVVQTPKLFHSMSNILLVDDHPVMRALLRQVLEAYPDIVIVAEAEDGEEAVRLATKFQPDVAIIDLHLPRLSGVQATKLIRVQSPCTAIIGLTAGEPDDREMEIISAGASAVLNKADVFRELHRSIVKAVRLAAFYPAHLNKPASDCKAGS